MRARTAVLAPLAAVSVLAAASRACGREGPPDARAAARRDRGAREGARDAPRRLNELIVKDPRLEGMPETPVRVGVPTTLARDLIQRVVAGFVDQVTLELKNLKVKKSGTVKKVVTLGQYDLNVTINRVIGQAEDREAGRDVRGQQGRDRAARDRGLGHAAAPPSTSSGTARTCAGATCGDLEVTQEVSGSVRPDSYPVAGGLVLTATAKDILAQPRFPLIKVNLKVVPSEESWAAVQKILDEKEGLCGYVVDKVNVRGIVQKLDRQGLQRPPAHREDQADGGARGHRADHGGARPAGRPRDQGRRPRHHRARDLARGPTCPWRWARKRRSRSRRRRPAKKAPPKAAEPKPPAT